LLKKAVEWDVIDRMPSTIRLLKTSSGSMDFYDFDEYAQLVKAAAKVDTMTQVIVFARRRFRTASG
jgi:hypothetical protein